MVVIVDHCIVGTQFIASANDITDAMNRVPTINVCIRPTNLCYQALTLRAGAMPTVGADGPVRLHLPSACAEGLKIPYYGNRNLAFYRIIRKNILHFIVIRDLFCIFAPKLKSYDRRENNTPGTG
jgi:hypothetical protein